MKTSPCILAVAVELLLTLNPARAVIDFDPAPDPATQPAQPPPPPPPPSTNPPPPTSSQPPPTAGTPEHPNDERRFYFFNKLNLTDEQKAQIKIIMATNQDWREKRKQMMDLLTMDQKIQLKAMVDNWKTNHPSPAPGNSPAQP